MANESMPELVVTITKHLPFGGLWGWEELVQDEDGRIPVGEVECEHAKILVSLFNEDVIELLDEAAWSLRVGEVDDEAGI